jgi:glycogen debranching enzyme
MSRPDTCVCNRLVGENVFLRLPREHAALPGFAESRDRLPAPIWPGHERDIDCYWKAWEIAFRNLRQPPARSPLIANFIDTAFNDCTFMWDSSFMTMFGRYGSRVFNFQRTLDNFYRLQHRDGFICREIAVQDGTDRFERFDPSSTGPNIMPWAEWEYYLNFGDKERLGRVFPVLTAYTQWLRSHRTWPDGTYWSSGWGCGMDNQPRLPSGYNVWFDHGHMSWIDTTLQQIFANHLLIRMAGELGRDDEMGKMASETGVLSEFVNHHMWDHDAAFYFDRYRNGGLGQTKTIGAYWALLADVVPKHLIDAFIAHLGNPAEFARVHRVPTLSAGDSMYDKAGGYWCGSVWAPTNYMVLRGLTNVGENALAHEIAMNHLRNVVEVFKSTGTLWENYAPESAAPGRPARGDFVGWTGLSPIAVLFEYAFGLRPEVSRNQLVWDVRLLDRHGVERYPFGRDTMLDLQCEQRKGPADEPVIKANANKPLSLVIQWAGGAKTIHLNLNP